LAINNSSLHRKDSIRYIGASGHTRDDGQRRSSRRQRSRLTDFVLDALEQAICHRGGAGVDDLVHHNDRGTQYLSMRYTERLAEAGIAPSVGSRGDSYDNALAEPIIGLFKTEVIQRKGPWRHLPRSNSRRSTGSTGPTTGVCWKPIGYVPPAEYEARYYSDAESQGVALAGIHIPTALLTGTPPSGRMALFEHCRMRYGTQSSEH
jgi:hypothetical protein